MKVGDTEKNGKTFSKNVQNRLIELISLADSLIESVSGATGGNDA